MKFAIVLAALVAVALARPQKDVETVKYSSDNIGVGGYNWQIELSNGQQQSESAQLKNAGTEQEAISVQGRFYYVAPDGTPIEVTYIADENGFQPQGAHLPHAP